MSVLGMLVRTYLWRGLLAWLPGGKRVLPYSINLMRARNPEWFKDDLEELMRLLETGAIRPRVAERIALEDVADAHRRLEAGGVPGKLVLCPGESQPRCSSRASKELAPVE